MRVLRRLPAFAVGILKGALILWGLLLFLPSLDGRASAELTGVSQISAGYEHACALTSVGGVKCWGNNNFGQVGDGTTITRFAPVDVVGYTSGVSVIAPGGSHTCLVTTGGGAKCWGAGAFNVIGDGTGVNRDAPVDVTGLTTGVLSITAGASHTCALTTMGGVKCWGINSYGALGDGTFTTRAVPVDVVGLTSGASIVDVGDSHTCAVTTSGGAKCWGRNNRRQLGDGTTINRSSPVDVTGLTTGVMTLSAMYRHTCAVTTSGGVKCWGESDYGELGDGTNAVRWTAVDVTGLTSGVARIAAGYNHTCAITSIGGAKCWGKNDFAQTGDGASTDRYAPVDVVGYGTGLGSVSAGVDFTCAMTTDGRVRCWGYNRRGQLGDGTILDRYMPDDVMGLASGVSGLDSASGHTCAATTSGGAECWGSNYFGKLGDGTLVQRFTPVDVSGLSDSVGQVFTGANHTCAVTTSGGAKCWGSNLNGQLGDGTTTDRIAAVDVLGLTSGILSASAGNGHTCTVTTPGGAKCWGGNSSGQLGDGTTTQRNSAVDVTGLVTGVVFISAGTSHTCVVTTSGGAKCWGYNSNGQLGDGTTTQRITAVDVSGLTGVASISAGNSHTCALTTSEGAKCWGYNSNGQLGDGTTTQRTTAVDVAGLTSGVAAVSAGEAHTCVVTTSGSAKCWGLNSTGQLGDGTTTQRNIAVDVVGMASGVSTISAGYSHTCAITTSGSAKCWGSNYFGALGTGEPFVHSVMLGRSVQGVVTLSGSPLVGAVVRVTGMGAAYPHQESASDGSGIYALGVVEDVPYVVTPELAGYTFTPPSISGTMAADVTQDFVATLLTYNITGTVTANSNPLSGATVDGGALGTATTDAGGNYSFNAVGWGTVYTLTVSHAGAVFGVSTANGTLSSHATHDFSGTLNTYDLTGTVMVGGTPLAGVTVDAGSLGSTVTDGSGAYSFSGINYGTSYTLTPSLADHLFSPVSASGALTGNTTRDFAATYIPPSTTTVAATTTVASTSTVGTSITSTTTPVTTPSTTTADPASTTSLMTTSVEITTTIESGTSTVLGTTTSSIATTTTSAPQDSDNDGLTDTEEAALGTNPEGSDSDGDGVADGEEAQTGTNPKDPGSKQPKLRTTICSEWNGYLGGLDGRGMTNIMEHVNLSNKKLRVKTELRSIRGHLKSTYEFFLRGNQQFDLLVHDMSGRETNSYGQVCTTYERAPAGSLDGRMVYYKFGSKSGGAAGGGNDAGSSIASDTGADTGSGIQFAFALPFENPSIGSSALLFNTHQPSTAPEDAGNLVANWVQLSNVSRKRLKGKLYFHALDGSVVGRVLDVNLRDGARYDYSAHEQVSGSGTSLAGQVRFVPSDKTVEYQLRGVRYLYDNAGGEDSFATAYPFGAAAGSGEMLHAPVDGAAAASGDGSAGDVGLSVSSAVTRDVTLELANTLAKKVNVRIRLYDSTGKKVLYDKAHALKGYSGLHLSLTAMLGNSVGNMGQVIVQSSHAASLVGNVVSYGRDARGAVRNMVAVELREPIGKLMKGSYNTYLNQGCTLFLINSALSKEKVRISLRQSDGTTPLPDFDLSVPARGAVRDDLCDKLGANSYGVITVQASKAKRISAMMLRTGEDESYRMATVLR